MSMHSCGQSRAAHQRLERIRREMRYRLYLTVLILLVVGLYIAPEWAVLGNLLSVPRGSLDVDVPAGTTLWTAASQLWQDRYVVLNPMSNAITRFFAVTSVVGFMLDRVIAAKRQAEAL